MAEAKIIARNLTKRYGTYTAVEGLNLTVHAGEIFGLLGPNGAGKTTSIEMMEGIRRPDAGTCTICGFDSITQSAGVRERIGLTLQAASMPETARVSELLELYASLYPNPARPGDLLQQFNLVEKARSTAKSLSGGQRQRLSLALALVGRPEVLFLDEPTTGLDPQARHSLWDVIRGLKAEGRAVIMSTHYMEEAEKLCDRVAIMDHGKILAEGTPRELVREFGPEAAIEIDVTGFPVNMAEIAQLSAVTGVQTEDHLLVLRTANTAASLMAFAGYAQANHIPLGELRTRSATMEDVFMALTGRRLRD
ncbi:MAG: transporter ATP-binding protein [Symbiobacteriaceae bacterium]|jgi:ABC-2 type transport system ATP-binding protein|nr:transporter ATP-binding protein [Symbiobacteriaceae bacterium]